MKICLLLIYTHLIIYYNLSPDASFILHNFVWMELLVQFNIFMYFVKWIVVTLAGQPLIHIYSIVIHYYMFIIQRFFYSWRGWDPYSNVKTRIFFVFENWKSSILPKQGTSNTYSKNTISFTTVYFYKGIDFEIKRLKRVSAILNSVYLW